MYYLLSAMDLNRLASQNAQPLLTSTMIKAQTIGLPSSEEQSQIALHIKKQIAKVDDLIFNFSNQISLYQEYRTALISEAVTGKIDVREDKYK